MNQGIAPLRELLEAGDVSAFLVAYQEYRKRNGVDSTVTGMTQRVFPPLLREAFKSGKLTAHDIILLWRLVRDQRLLLVENDLIVCINQQIDAAIKAVEPNTSLPVQALATFDSAEPSQPPYWLRRPISAKESNPAPAVAMKRVTITSAFTFGTWSMSDAFDFRKNLCASRQEAEFLCAVRQYFPSLQAYPNVPLRNFIDIDKLESMVPVRVRNYAWSAQVDVLLCTADEDSVMGIELDSSYHDSEEVAERDALKNRLFEVAGLPLVRIRADEVNAVRAEDFYDLLVARAQELDAIRPRRLRQRRSHDFLVPAEEGVR